MNSDHSANYVFQNVPEIAQDTNAGWKVRETGVFFVRRYISA